MTAAALVVAGIALARVAGAEPYIAVREGLPCSACHVNVTGGGMRTDLVRTHARDILHYPLFFGRFSSPPEYFTGDINKYLALGADLRVSDTAIFQENPVNGRVDNNTVFKGTLQSNSIDVNQFTVYGEARLIPEYLIAYIDQRFAPTVDNREAWLMLRGVLPWEGFVKAGQMFLPYGLQIWDDSAFIRAGRNGSARTGFSFNASQAGLEVGAQPGPMSVFVAVTDGPSGDRSAQITGTVYGMFADLPVIRSVFVGGSGSYVQPPGSEQTIFGFFGGTNFERLTLLGEADFLSVRNPQSNGQNLGHFISYVEADYLFFGWLNFKVAVDYSDWDGSAARSVDDAENRVLFGFEPFWNRFLQTRLFFAIGNGVESQPTHNQNVLYFEIHGFL